MEEEFKNISQYISLDTGLDFSQSYWVEASAGCGKTELLIRRVLYLLTFTDKPITCITFTNAAAEEILARIEAKLTTLSRLDSLNIKDSFADLESIFGLELELNDVVISYCLKISQNIQSHRERISVSTIHTLCGKLLQSSELFTFGVDIKTAPELEEDMQDFIMQKLAEIIQNERKELLPSFKRVIKNLGYSGLKNAIVAIILKRYQIMHNLKTINAEMLEKTRVDMDIDNIDSLESILQDFFNTTFQLQETLNLEEFLLCISDVYKKSTNNILGNVSIKISNYLSLQQTNNHLALEDKFTRIYDCFVGTSGNLLSIDRTLLTKKVTDSALHGFATQFRDFIEKLTSFHEKIANLKIFEISWELLQIANESIDIYDQIKNGRLNFDDIIAVTNDKVKNQQIDISQEIGHLLIDEAQDISTVQWNLLDNFIENILKQKGCTLFVVGDSKQSIYSFQGAIYESFIQKKIDYQAIFTRHKSKLNILSIEHTYRSWQYIMDFVDECMKKAHLSVNQKDEELYNLIKDDWQNLSHQSKRKPSKQDDAYWLDEQHVNNSSPQIFYETLPIAAALEVLKKLEKPADKSLPDDSQENPPDLEDNDSDSDDNDDSDNDSGTLHLLNAYKAREIIFDLLDKKRIPHYKPNEIMILTRSRKDIFTDKLTDLLAEKDISLVSDKNTLQDNFAILDLLALSTFARFPFNEINLAGLLKSPLFCFNDLDLLEIIETYANLNADGSLWEKISGDLNEIKSPAIREKCMAAKIKLNLILEKGRSNSASTFYGYIFKEFYSDLLKSSSSKQSRASLDLFFMEIFSLAEQFSDNFPLLHEHLVKNKVGNDKLLDIENNAIKIISVHKAKGLQAKAVIIVGNNETLNSSDKLLLNPLQMPLFLGNFHSKYIEEHKRKRKISSYREEMRLLYVALTRAQDEIFLVHHKKELKSNNSKLDWFNVVKEWKNEWKNE